MKPPGRSTASKIRRRPNATKWSSWPVITANRPCPQRLWFKFNWSLRWTPLAYSPIRRRGFIASRISWSLLVFWLRHSCSSHYSSVYCVALNTVWNDARKRPVWPRPAISISIRCWTRRNSPRPRRPVHRTIFSNRLPMVNLLGWPMIITSNEQR